MKVRQLRRNPDKYTCFSYYIRGDWNALNDVNTLIDIGLDDFIYDELKTFHYGIGNKLVNNIIITHEHFDHTGGVMKLKELTGAKVYSFNENTYADIKAYDGMKIRAGDSEATILHTPGHSEDSICIYFEKEKILFSGDTQINIRVPGGIYSSDYLRTLEKLCALDIEVIYSGHNLPILSNIKAIIENSMINVMKSEVI